GKANGSPYDEGNREKPVGERFLAAAFQPENVGNSEKKRSRRKYYRNIEPAERICSGPYYKHASSRSGGYRPKLALRVHLRAKKEKDSRRGVEQLIESSLERPSVGKW